MHRGVDLISWPANGEYHQGYLNHIQQQKRRQEVREDHIVNAENS